MEREDILRIVHFAVGKLNEENWQSVQKKLDDMEKRLDETQLKRAKEVRQSLSVHTQMPETGKVYSGTAVPAYGLGTTGDFYRRLDGSGLIIEDYWKPDGKWLLIGGYASTNAPNLLATTLAAPPTGYGSLIGAVDGVNTTFQVPEGVYVAGALTAYWQGQTLFNGNGMTETDASTGTFDVDVAPKNSPRQEVNARYK